MDASVSILPNVTIGRGAVVNAGSVVNRLVPPMTMAQQNLSFNLIGTGHQEMPR